MTNEKKEVTCFKHNDIERRIKQNENEIDEIKKEVEVLKRETSVTNEQVNQIYDTLSEIKDSIKDINTTFNTAIRRPLETREKIKIGVVTGIITTIFSFWIASL